MSINVPTGEIRSAGASLSEIAGRMQKLSNRAGALSSAIAGCYMQGGVGSRPAAAASRLQAAASQLRTRADSLTKAAGIYEKAEYVLQIQGEEVAACIKNGYNVSWTDSDVIRAAIAAGTVAIAAGAVLGEAAVGGETPDSPVSLKGTTYAEWDVEKGNVGVGAKGSASVSAWKWKEEQRIGNLSGEAEISVGAVKAEGKAAFTLVTDGEFDPTLKAEVSAEGSVLSGKAEAAYGSDDFNAHVSGKGSVLKGEAKASLNVSKDGLAGEAKVGGAVLSGKATGGFTLWGVKFDLSVQGEVLSAGAEAEFGVKKNEFMLGGKLSFVAGLGLKLKVSW